MALIDALNLLYPDAVPGRDYVLQNDGDGDYIKSWNLTAKKPSAAALREAEAATGLHQAKTAKLAELKAACRAIIEAGFTSSALGEPHSYPATDTDQRNLHAAVLASLLPNLPDDWTTPAWCRDSTGQWARRPHTVAQIQQVGREGKQAIDAAVQRKAEREAEVLTANSASDVFAIVWDQGR